MSNNLPSYPHVPLTAAVAPEQRAGNNQRAQMSQLCDFENTQHPVNFCSLCFCTNKWCFLSIWKNRGEEARQCFKAPSMASTYNQSYGNAGSCYAPAPGIGFVGGKIASLFSQKLLETESPRSHTWRAARCSRARAGWRGTRVQAQNDAHAPLWPRHPKASHTCCACDCMQPWQHGQGTFPGRIQTDSGTSQLHSQSRATWHSSASFPP